MKTIVLVSLTLVAIANCRPDVSHLPSSSYLPVKQPTSHVTTSHSDPSDTHHQVHDERHVYFYATPSDGHQTKLQINVVPNTLKNTKLIFVKAPYHAGIIPEVIAPESLSEDKTLVYVLSKKPALEQSISIPAGLGIKQVKPEVFFIKYNNKQEAEAEIKKGINGHKIGLNVPDLENEYSFLNALESKDHGHGQSHGGSKTHDNSKHHDSSPSVADTIGTKTKSNDGTTTTVSSKPPVKQDSQSHTVVITEEEKGSNSKKHGPAGASGPY